MRSIKCDICKKQVTPTGGKQRTCLSRECRLKLRSKNRKVERRADRKRNPIPCIWCGEPITQIGKREYHPECKAAKNRERVKRYNQTHKSRTGPKKSRIFKDEVKCEICKMTVRRTAARQTTCGSDECQRERRLNKARDRELAQIRAEKERRFHAHQPCSVSEPQVYRIIG